MSDFIDATIKREEGILNAAIANRKTYEGVSAVECIECGEPIPQGRRDALPGVKHCVDYAGRTER